MTDITKKDKKEQSAKEKIVINLYDLVSILASAIVTIAIIFTFVFRVVGVSGTSMVPTLNNGDWLLVSAVDFEPKYGQIVIITQPNAFDKPLVKRIIATENQVVDINTSTGEVSVDGKVLDEPYINNLTIDDEGTDFPVTVPENCVFVMGDNRQGSTDSRSSMVGFIQEEYIMGVAKYKAFAADEFGNVKFNSFSNWKLK